MAIVVAFLRSAWRATVSLSGGESWTTTDPTNYAVTRADGGYTAVTVTAAWSSDTAQREIAFSETLVAGLAYVITVPDASTAVVRRDLTTIQQLDNRSPEDPEAEAFGIDSDWLTDLGLDSEGDAPEIHGVDCMLNDLVALAFLQPGEEIHHPDSGAGLESDVNDTATDDELAAKQGKLRRAWAADDRTKTADIDIVQTADGETYFIGLVYPKALDGEPLRPKARV